MRLHIDEFLSIEQVVAICQIKFGFETSNIYVNAFRSYALKRTLESGERT